MRLKRLEYPTWFLNCHKESLKNMKRQRDTVRSGLISNYSVLPQIALLCLTINRDIVNRYKLGCLCALLVLLWCSVGELGDCQKARTGPAGLIGSKEQGLNPGEVAKSPTRRVHSRCMSRGQKVERTRHSF